MDASRAGPSGSDTRDRRAVRRAGSSTPPSKATRAGSGRYARSPSTDGNCWPAGEGEQQAEPAVVVSLDADRELAKVGMPPVLKPPCERGRVRCVDDQSPPPSPRCPPSCGAAAEEMAAQLAAAEADLDQASGARTQAEADRDAAVQQAREDAAARIAAAETGRDAAIAQAQDEAAGRIAAATGGIRPAPRLTRPPKPRGRPGRTPPSRRPPPAPPGKTPAGSRPPQRRCSPGCGPRPLLSWPPSLPTCGPGRARRARSRRLPRRACPAARQRPRGRPARTAAGQPSPCSRRGVIRPRQPGTV